MYLKKHFIRLGEGGAQPNISRTKIVNTIISVPNYKEQLAIVKGLDEVFQLIGLLH